MTESTAIQKTDPMTALEAAIVAGDLSKLTPTQRVQLYRKTCESLNLNPYTKPFDYIQLNGKLTLYATKTATDQLRNLHRISLRITGTDITPDSITFTVLATDPDGRTDEDCGTVSINSTKGDAYCNARMKALTKAKRRVTLSICGLGWMNDTEIETVSDAKPVPVDMETGEIVDPPKPSNGTTHQPSKPPASAHLPGRPEGRGPFYCADCGDIIRARLNVKTKTGLHSYQPLEIAQGTFDTYGVALCWDHSNKDAAERAKAKQAREVSEEPITLPPFADDDVDEPEPVEA